MGKKSQKRELEDEEYTPSGFRTFDQPDKEQTLSLKNTNKMKNIVLKNSKSMKSHTVTSQNHSKSAITKRKVKKEKQFEVSAKQKKEDHCNFGIETKQSHKIQDKPFLSYLKNVACVKMEGNLITQCVGHYTVVMKHSLIEGTYYLEIQVQNPFASQITDYSKSPNLRLGICEANQKADYPIGVKNSVAFNVLKNMFFSDNRPIQTQKKQKQQKTLIEFEKKLQKGDIFGIEVHLPPPTKLTNTFQTRDLQWEGSYIRITRNGLFLSQFKGLKQRYYNLAISLFNCPLVSINMRKEKLLFLRSQAKPYSEITEYICPYTLSSLNLPKQITSYIKFQSQQKNQKRFIQK